MEIEECEVPVAGREAAEGEPVAVRGDGGEAGFAEWEKLWWLRWRDAVEVHACLGRCERGDDEAPVAGQEGGAFDVPGGWREEGFGRGGCPCGAKGEAGPAVVDAEVGEGAAVGGEHGGFGVGEGEAAGA